MLTRSQTRRNQNNGRRIPSWVVRSADTIVRNAPAIARTLRSATNAVRDAYSGPPRGPFGTPLRPPPRNATRNTPGGSRLQTE